MNDGLPVQSVTNPGVQLLTVTETARALNIGKTQLYKLLKEGRLPIRAVRVGEHLRFSRRDVERYCHGDQHHDDGQAA